MARSNIAYDLHGAMCMSGIGCERVTCSAGSATQGITRSPHLHFGLTDGPAPLSSNSVPFEIERFTLQGVVTGTGDEPGVIIGGTPRAVRKAHPIFPSVAEFG